MKKVFGIIILFSLSFCACAKDSFNKSKLELLDVKHYDINGNLVEETWSDGYSFKYFYDENNNRIRSEQSTGIQTEYKTQSDNEVLETWSDGTQKLYIYDLNHNLVREYWKTPEERKFNNYTEYTFIDNREVRYSVYNKSGKTTTYWNYYDENGLLIRRTNSNGEEYFFEFEYYDNGNVKTRYMYELKSKKKNKSIDEIHQMLTKINPSFWPSINTDSESLVLQYIGSTDKYKIYQSLFIWGESIRVTPRLIVFKDDKYLGHYSEINSSDMFIDGDKLVFNDFEEEYGYIIDFSKGVPKKVYIDGETVGFTK